jgi:hypothetical protein
MTRIQKSLLVVAVLLLMAACSTMVPRPGWNKSLGPVVPHDSFPADCALCHESGSWNKIKPDFVFDHKARTGVALLGAHATATCLLCHNDRGPVKTFADRGCSGCHQDIHRGRQGARCEDCHNQSNWKPLAAIETHSRTRFPLIGAHAAVACFRCHPGAPVGNFESPSIACADCHRADAAKVKNPDHTSLSLTGDCQKCHTQSKWRPASFTHPASFPLSGGHANPQCSACHTSGAYTGLSTECSSCHMSTFQRTASPNHVIAGFGTNCTQCHNTTRWQGAQITHPAAFPLVKGHAGRSCIQCHTTPGVYSGLSTDCSSCHLDDYQLTANPNHAAANISTTCTNCHNTTRWQGARFSHPASFALTKGHAGRSCNQCHTTPGVFTGLSTDCASCHTADYQRTTSPPHASAGYPTTCAQCHTTTQWQGATFTHTPNFPLTLGHAGRACNQCHTTPGVFTGLSTDCASCHTGTYQATTNPKHVAPAFPTNCTQCHNTTRWTGASFSHTTSFPLADGHAGRACNQCHTTPGVYTGLSTTCSSCHLTTYQHTTNPNHVTAGFPTNCTQCHNTRQWQGATFAHTSTFPLTNGHAGRGCTLCHTTPGVYTGLSTTCSSCHLTNYQNTTNPNHATAGYPTTCTQCHNTRQWQGATFTHPAAFPLTNGHAGRGCTLCHTTPGVYTGLSTACSNCHLADFQRTTNPNHAAANFSQTCTDCHNTTRWQGASFRHSTTFPLTNGHAGRGCTVCHTIPGTYAGLSTACYTCHTPDYQRTTNPNHAAAGFPVFCKQCHTTVSWQGAVFNHAASFPLTAGHAGRACNTCHTTPGVFTGLSTTCSTCHLDDYQHTTNPNHVSLAYPTNCTQCHNTTRWQGATFTHPATFPLTNGHSGRGCTLCHTTPGVYTGQSTACSSCHNDEYARTVNPKHSTPAFSHACTQCHNTTRWTGAIFQHPTTFALSNGHAGRACVLCHTTPGVYTGLNSSCVTCHMTAYQQTTAPNHASLAYPTTCTQCHTTTRWQGAVFNHPSSFPLTSGHAGRACTTCHATPGVYTGLTTACSSCHNDEYARTTTPKHSTPAFSHTCTQCHNTATWTGANFPHPASFALTNGHGGRACVQCHTVPGVYSGLSTACVSCHQTAFQQTTNPNHVSAGFPTACTQCHNTTHWQGATFNHPATFPLTNAHAGRTCTVCHTTPGTFAGLSAACSSCHDDEYVRTTNPRHSAPAFGHTCTQCHNTTRWTGAAFPHPATFALTNGHAGRTCVQCHTVPGVYTGRSTACASCHLTRYQQTTNPNHAQLGYPTTCNTCHNTTTWANATFNHTFPITSGPHRNLRCIDCHTVPAATPVFSCTHCHEHRQSAAANDHQGVNNYVWTSQACFQCHPQGRH